ncbi:unnamed protein product [Lupinus luteus]|uniref:BURP domain-containing protein n=1 Tax=Lupinus luteus TaxID=3873 RepID=A0AAV1WYY6_LUPLU
MEFSHLSISIFVLFSVAVVGDEDLWQTLWPNTPIPNTLTELLNPNIADTEVNELPMKISNTQYSKTFFFKHDLYPGKTINMQFSKSPFQQPFGVHAWLKQVKNVDKEGYTFEELCIKKDAIKGEDKYCAKSLKTLVGFAISKLGKNIEVFSSSFVDNQEQYTVQGMQNLGEKAVMCHRLNFQTVAFYCHEVHATTAFMVSLVADDGTKTKALAICHTDTSGMNHNMLSQILQVDPGTKPVCHFLGNKEVLWIPN